jgi:hypothetical protein
MFFEDTHLNKKIINIIISFIFCMIENTKIAEPVA